MSVWGGGHPTNFAGPIVPLWGNGELHRGGLGICNWSTVRSPFQPRDQGILSIWRTPYHQNHLPSKFSGKTTYHFLQNHLPLSLAVKNSTKPLTSKTTYHHFSHRKPLTIGKGGKGLPLTIEYHGFRPDWPRRGGGQSVGYLLIPPPIQI